VRYSCTPDARTSDSQPFCVSFNLSSSTQATIRLAGPHHWPTIRRKSAWAPTIEVKEKEGKLFVTAELPGVKKEEVKVHIDGDTLVVEVERKQEKDEKREGYYHSIGAMPPSLPEGAKIDQTAAQFNNGVLEVSVPIPEVKAKSQDVPIQEAAKPKAA
jgi:HSP20 family protein